MPNCGIWESDASKTPNTESFVELLISIISPKQHFSDKTKSSASKMAKKGSSIKSFACRTAWPKPNGSFCSTKLKVIESKFFGFTNLR